MLHIRCPDEAITRLPWVLLAQGGGFLIARGWSPVISSGARQPRDCLLPAAPRILVVAPRPQGVADTQAEAHLKALGRELARFDARLALGKRLRAVETWEDCVAQLKGFKPQVVYYYGHGLARGSDASTRLVFAAGPRRRREDRPVADLAGVLRGLEEPPLLAYINCCQGDAGGLLGVGRQLETEAGIPAVITNRTIAEIPAAQAQAMQLFENLLPRGEPPHQAVHGLYRDPAGLGLSTADVRWLTPVLHAHYGDWRTSARPAAAPDTDPDWSLKIDRVSQFSLVDNQTRQMLREGRPRCMAFVWYGREDDGVDLFHHRLEVELQESLRGMDTAFLPIAPDWPEELGNSDLSFRDKTLEACEEVLGAERLEDIPYSLRTHSLGRARSLIYVRHRPVPASNRLINPETLDAYLAWWDEHLLPLLEPDQFVLIGVSFVVRKPGAFQNAMAEQAIGEENPLRHGVFHLLNRMDALARGDLRTFLRTHRIGIAEGLSNQTLNRLLDEILARTGGRYEQTVEELKGMEGLIRNLDAGGEPPREKKKFDY